MKNILKALLLSCGIILILIVSGPKLPRESISKDEEQFGEKRGVFISYIELSKYLKNKSAVEGKENIDLIIKNIKELGFNEVIVQVRSFSDAIYPSKIFPWSSVVSSAEGVEGSFDILKYFIEKAHKEEVEFIAWINPYRIRSQADISGISSQSPAYAYLNSDVVYIGDGIYFNPSKEYTHNLVVSGVLELVKNYKVDGVLFDDYFYPNNEIDIKDYEAYIESNAYISKEQYNLDVVSRLIKDVHDVCNKYGVLFGVSPDGNIENNYNKVFADVKKWCSSNEYVDFIMPQIYYGFLNEARSFKKAIDEWESIVTDLDVGLQIALAFYKVGENDYYAKGGSKEWMENKDIIMREIIMSRNLKQYEGFSLFRYDYLYNEELYNEMTLNEIENMKKVLN